MEIAELKPKQGKVDITVKVADKGDIREFQKFGKAGRVCNATVKDASGEIKLTLWNEDIDKVNVGDTIKIENGFVNEWQGELQLTTGRFGKMEVVDSAGVTSDEETEANILDKEETKTDKGEHVLTKDEVTEEEIVEEEKKE